jgi:hypothetical protein
MEGTQMARKQRTAKTGPAPTRDFSASPGPDDLLDAALDNWTHILRMYRHFYEKKPIVLYDIQERRIYVYPYREFRAELSERSQLSLTEQYEKAVLDGKIVVFVRDNVGKRLRAFTLDPESQGE